MILLGPELVLNGDFEAHATEAQSWSCSKPSGSSLWVTSDDPFAGENHAFFDVTTTGFSWYIKNVPLSMIVSGENYQIGAAISPSTGSLMVVSVNPTAGGAHIGLGDTFVPETTSIPSWHYYTWDFGCTKSDYPAVYFGFYYVVSSRQALFDAVSFRRKIDISAGYDYKNGKILDRILSRNIGGSLRVYTGPGSHRKFNIPISWVSSKDASAINSWWQTGTDLRIIENDDFPNSYYNVRIIGDKQPLNRYQQAHFGEYLTGVLDMETV